MYKNMHVQIYTPLIYTQTYTIHTHTHASTETINSKKRKKKGKDRKAREAPKPYLSMLQSKCSKII